MFEYIRDSPAFLCDMDPFRVPQGMQEGGARKRTAKRAVMNRKRG